MIFIDYVMSYLWAGNKNDLKLWVAFAIIMIIIIVTIMIIMVSNNTSGCS